MNFDNPPCPVALDVRGQDSPLGAHLSGFRLELAQHQVRLSATEEGHRSKPHVAIATRRPPHAHQGMGAKQAPDLEQPPTASLKGGSGQTARAELYKYAALLVLVVQNSALALTMRYSRTVSGEMYISSTAVVVSEFVKLISATALVLAEEKSTEKLWTKLHREIILKPDDFLKLLVPAVLYTIQNNLAYVAVSNLDAASYQVLYQLKILTTAIFSVLLLRRQLDWFKWMSLVVLVAGVSLVQLSGLRDDASSTKTNNVIGLISVLLACCSSGFAGVYFEKVLKGSDVSVWVRNVELAIIGIFVGLIGVYYADAGMITELGFFYGYTPVVWGVICLQAFGGIVVAVVVKYADNLLKGFATSISIILSCVLTFLLFSDFNLSFKFLVGTSLVVASTMMYSTSPATALSYLSLCLSPPGSKLAEDLMPLKPPAVTS